MDKMPLSFRMPLLYRFVLTLTCRTNLPPNCFLQRIVAANETRISLLQPFQKIQVWQKTKLSTLTSITGFET